MLATAVRPTGAPAPLPLPERPSGAELVCAALHAHGVAVLFGYPGGAALPLYHVLNRTPRRARRRSSPPTRRWRPASTGASWSWAARR